MVRAKLARVRMTEQPPNPGAGERKPAAHAGPPVETATETLDERGQATASVLERIAGSAALEAGGRDDIPWVLVAADRLHEIAQCCRDDRELRMDMLHCLFAVDYVEHIQVVYILFSMQADRKVMLKVNLPADNPSVATVTNLWMAASWYERETHDLFGVKFEGNDDLEPLLLFHGFEGHPGLKSFPLHDFQEW